jgi:amino acid transporter
MLCSDVALFRGLTRVDVFALTLNNIVGAGVFTMPAALAAGAGAWSVGVLLLAIGLVAILALCAVEVASRYDVTGGPMHYAGEAFGPSAGFVVGWLMYLSRLSAFGAIASTMLDYGSGLWPALDTLAVRAVVLTAFVAAIAAINIRGVVQGALSITILTVVKSVPLVLLALGGVWLGRWAVIPSAPPSSLEDLGRAALVAIFACMGFEPAMVLAGEVRNPRRDLPVGLLAGLAGAGVLYVLLLLTCFQTVPDLANSTRPLADAATTLVGPAGATLVLFTAVVACGGSLSGWMTTSPRVLYALAVERDMPSAFAAVHAVHRTPAAAILVSAVLVWVMTVSGTFIYLASFAAITRLLTYASTCGALIVLRRRIGPAPVPVPGGPVLAVIALATVLVTLVSITGSAVRDVVIALALGWLWRTASRRAPLTLAADASGPGARK